MIVKTLGDIKGHPGCDHQATGNKEEDREGKEGVSSEGTGPES